MSKAPFIKVITIAKRAVLTVVSSLCVLLPASFVWAQQRQMTAEDMRQMEQTMAEFEAAAVWIQLGVNVLFLVVFGGILLYARGNMKGWSQPIKEVWFSFEGRLNRKAYWLKGVLLLSMVGIAVQIVGLLFGTMMGENILSLISGLAFIAVLLPMFVLNIWVGLAVSIKRFHDLGSSGWWVLGLLVPFLNIWLAIKLAFFRGTPGPNTFGPDPIDPVADYIDEMTGGGEDEDGDEAASAPVQPKPRAPQGDGAAPKGFGAKKFTKPVQARAPDPEPQADAASVEIAGGRADLDVIKRRLGDDIMRPIKRKGGGGRDGEG